MNKHTKIALAVLAVFIVGMTLSVAFAEPVNAHKYKNKNCITVKVKDGKKTIKVKCKFELPRPCRDQGFLDYFFSLIGFH